MRLKRSAGAIYCGITLSYTCLIVNIHKAYKTIPWRAAVKNDVGPGRYRYKTQSTSAPCVCFGARHKTAACCQTAVFSAFHSFTPINSSQSLVLSLRDKPDQRLLVSGLPASSSRQKGSQKGLYATIKKDKRKQQAKAVTNFIQQSRLECKKQSSARSCCNARR